MENHDVVGSCNELNLDLGPSNEVSLTPNEEYVLLQQRIFFVTLIVTACVVAISAFFFGFQTSLSILVGSFSGIIYLRLLARSVEKLGTNSKSLSKIQLLIPVLLVLGASRLQQLELFPCLLGFLLYKPSLILQVFFESKSGN